MGAIARKAMHDTQMLLDTNCCLLSLLLLLLCDVNVFGDLMGATARKAMHDTQMLFDLSG
jgi:hypothetical protein